jgi:hypothetical protein
MSKQPQVSWLAAKGFVDRVRDSCSSDHEARGTSTIAKLEKPDAELQMKPMVLERVFRIENFY